MNNAAGLCRCELVGGEMRLSLPVLLLVMLLPSVCWPLATTMEFGVRGGVDEATLKEHYAMAELYFLKDLPWQKEIAQGFRVYTRLDLGASYIKGDSENGGYVAAGGDLVFSLLDGALELETGVRPSLFSNHEFGLDDFGGPVQFISHAGATINLGNASINYRFQHISNGSLYNENPGLNFHVLGFGMRF